MKHVKKAIKNIGSKSFRGSARKKATTMAVRSGYLHSQLNFYTEADIGAIPLDTLEPFLIRIRQMARTSPRLVALVLEEWLGQ